MPKLILSCLIALTVTSLHAQSDFLVLKKRHTTVKSYYTGVYITVMLTNDTWLGGYITKIQHDSVYIKTFTERIYADAWGLHSVDTAFGPTQRIAVSSIKAVPKEHEGFAYIKDGSLFMIGAGGYMALNVINTVSHKDPLFGERNAPRLITAASVFGGAVILNLLHKNYIMLGRRYHLDYIKLNGDDNSK